MIAFLLSFCIVILILKFGFAFVFAYDSQKKTAIDERIDHLDMLVDKAIKMVKDAWQLNEIEKNLPQEVHLIENLTELMRLCLNKDVFDRTLSGACYNCSNQIQILIRKVPFNDNTIKTTVKTKGELRRKKQELLDGEKKVVAEATKLSKSFDEFYNNQIFTARDSNVQYLEQRLTEQTERTKIKMAEIEKYRF